MGNITVWMLIVCASGCTVGAIFLPPYQCRMWRVDAVELQRRRRMVDVLQSNYRSFGGDPVAGHPPAGAE
ncbi:hypothetical protein ACF1B0_11765 [Streptomyces anandii]|uniref:hypothetical protein n=1 Tax=Streptomyces anandii TaxID=285454 RepID=UPI0036F85E59